MTTVIRWLPGFHWIQAGIHRSHAGLPATNHGTQPAIGARDYFYRHVWSFGPLRVCVNAMPTAPGLTPGGTGHDATPRAK